MSTDAAMRTRFEKTTRQLMDDDPRLALVLAEIGGPDLFRAAKRHPERALNVGIREQLMIGVAAGFALAGYRPIVHTYAPFLVERPFEQVKLDLGHNDLGAVLVSVGASFDASSSGRTHQAPEDVAILSALPGWRIDVPGHADEAEALLRNAAMGDGRTYLRLSSQSNRSPVKLDGARMVPVRRGSGATIVAVGPMLDPVLDATRDLDVNVLYATTVRPFDGQTLRAVLGMPEVVIVEPYLSGTSAAVANERLRALPHRLLSLGVPLAEHRHYGTPEQHAEAHRLDARGIRQSIEAFIGGYR
jgi:transketolase